jgi:hypothetical protein
LQTLNPRSSGFQGGRHLIRIDARVFESKRDCRPVVEHPTSDRQNGLLDLGRRDPPTLLYVCGIASDQTSGNVIAVAALAFCRPLHIQRLAAFIEQLAREWTSRRLGLFWPSNVAK